MSDASASLPENPSLEQLRKQAKERASASGCSLMQAQRELARQYGFDSWAKLTEHVTSVNPPGLRRYEELAEALAAAYMTGDMDAIRRLNWTHGTSFAWDRDPERMRQRLPRWYTSPARGPELAQNDARHLVARAAGFDDWAALARSLGPAGRTEATSAAPSTESQLYSIDPDSNTMTVRGRLADSHWDAIVATMREQTITDLKAPGMTDGVLKRVCRIDGLRRLAVGGGVTDTGIRHLAKAPGLEDLELNGAHGVTDRGLDVLRDLKQLRRFQMCWARGISDNGVANLSFCESLEEVDLMGTATGDGAINAVTDLRHLQRFKSGKLVTDRGIPLFHRFPAFNKPNTEAVRFDLMSFSAWPTHLMLDGPFTDRGLAALAGLDGLVGLSFFWHCGAMTSTALAVLPSLPNLGFLGCQGALCDDVAMRHIGSALRLRMLMGQGTVASDVGFAALARSPTLEYLWGRECPNLRGPGFAALAAMPSLKGLGASLKHLDDAALSALPSFPSLRELIPMDMTDNGFRHVGQCTELERLWCMYCRDTGDAATGHLRGLSSLKTYYAGSTRITDRSLEILAGLHTLENIELWDVQGVSDAGIMALSQLPRLRRLSVEGSPRVTRAAFAAFPATVRWNYS